jgi:hypothetical protein
VQQKALPRAIVTAINFTVSNRQKLLREEMQKVFDRPKPFTVRSVLGAYASVTKGLYSGAVYLAEDAGKGVPANRYLSAEIKGGYRDSKASEKALRRVGVLAADEYLAPGPSARLDQFGNVPGSLYVQLLSFFSAFRESGVTQNRTGNSLRRNKNLKRFLIIRNGSPSGLRPAIYERKGQGLLPILNIIKVPKYKPRYDFYGVAEKGVQDEFDARFAAAIGIYLGKA